MNGKLYRYKSEVFATKLRYRQPDLVVEAAPFKGTISISSHNLFASRRQRIHCIVIDSPNEAFNNCNVYVDKATVMHYVFKNGLPPAQQANGHEFHIPGDFDWYWDNFCRPTLWGHNV